jgi:predicted Zn finger-like uncharacterized protein
MSLATRCPACGTIFRVVQDQLKVSEGWVRCGQCHEVFHGIEALFDLDSDPGIAARRAAVRHPVAPPPTRVFADARASAPIPIPTPAEPAPSAMATPAPPPSMPARQSVPATPSAFSSPEYPPAASVTRPGYTGFTPATRPLPPPSPIPPVATRGTIAPRFAARLAEESARAQGAAPSPIPSAYPPAAGPAASPPAPAPFGSALAEHAALSWQTPPAPVPAPAAGAFAAPPFVAVSAPVAEAPMTYAPAPAPAAVPVRVDTPPLPGDALPSPGELASAFAAPPPAAAAPEPASAIARETTPDVDGSAMPRLPADDAVDEANAGPPTLASMLPEDAGQWPPSRKKRRAPAATSTSTEVALVDRSKDPRFLREAKSGARWRKPWVRAVLSVALLLLIAAAVGQVAWPQRDTLAARWPATRPAWDWLCEQADCRIEAPRAIASLALDGSSLTRTDTEHVLLFSADLHNRSDHEVRVPSFDVTFMDLNGEIVARKVLTPEQIGIHQAALPAEGELHVHARLQVGTLAASGFQADLFYP